MFFVIGKLVDTLDVIRSFKLFSEIDLEYI